MFRPNKDEIFLIWEKLNFPFVCKELCILVSFFLRFKLIVLFDNSRSYIEPYCIVALSPWPSTFFTWLISVVKFSIENFFVKLIEAFETLPLNP